MRLLLLWAALVAVSVLASTPALAEANERATFLLEEKPHHPLALDRVAVPQFLHGPATWAVSPDGARATAQFEIPRRLKGSIDFLADKTLASPSRAMVIRLDLLDPANDPIVNVLVPAVDALEYPTGPRLKGVISRRDDKTFDVHLDEAEAAVDAKAIGIGRTIDVTFQLQSGRIGRVSIDHDAAAAEALARLFPPIPASARDEEAYEINLSDERAEADAAHAMFGNAPSGEACFTRVYDAEHLRSHPRLRVVAIALNVHMAPRLYATTSPWSSTKAIWSYAMSATLRNGIAAGALEEKVSEIKRVLSNDFLHNELLFIGRCAAVEDSPDEFALTDDSRHAIYSPLDEMGMDIPGATWPESKDTMLPRNLTKTDDDAFRLDRTDPSVCARIARRAHSAAKIIVGPGFDNE